MKRDFDVIRQILAYMEDLSQQITFEGDNNKFIEAFGIDMQTLAFHVNLLLDAEFIDAKVSSLDSGSCAVILFRNTWKGCEFIAAAKNENIWNKAKEYLKNNFTSFTLTMLQHVLDKVSVGMIS